MTRPKCSAELPPNHSRVVWSAEWCDQPSGVFSRVVCSAEWCVQPSGVISRVVCLAEWCVQPSGVFSRVVCSAKWCVQPVVCSAEWCVQPVVWSANLSTHMYNNRWSWPHDLLRAETGMRVPTTGQRKPGACFSRRKKGSLSTQYTITPHILCHCVAAT